MNKKKAIKVALVANTAWSIYNFRLGVMRAMLDKGIEVIAIAPRDDYADKLTAAGVTYISLNLKAHSTSPFTDMKTWYHLYQIYKDQRPDLVLHYTIKMNIYGSIACSWLGLTSISVVTGLGRTFQLSKYTQLLINRLYQQATKANQEVWVLNTEDKKRLAKEGIVESEKIFLLPSEGVNTRRFIGSEPKPNKKIFRFLYAGRLLHDKGILAYIEAARHMVQAGYKVRCEVVGFVNPEDSMSVSLNDLHKWQDEGIINYLGSHEDVRPFIDRADCIVYPSYYQEGVSRILLEAASMSRPIITTDQVGCRDVVQHDKNGFLIRPQSLEELISAMIKMMSLSHQDRIIMGHRGRLLVKELYDEEKIIKVYFDRLISDLIREESTTHKLKTP